MPIQQEELKLLVTLVDNASPGVEKLRHSLKDLGEGASVRNLEKFKKEAEGLEKVLGQFSETAEGAFKAFGAFRGGMVAGVGAMVTFGFELGRQIKDLAEYTDKLRHIGQLGRSIGVDPGTIKNISDQLGVYGVKADEAEASISKFITRLSEIQRDPRIFQEIMKDVAPGTVEQMGRAIASIEKAGTVEEKLNRARQLREDVRRNYQKQGLNEEQAAERTRTLMDKLGYDGLLGRAGDLKKRSAEQIEADNKRFENATAYSTKLGILKRQMEEISGLLTDPLIAKDSWLVFATDKFSEMLGVYKHLLELGGLPGIFKRGMEAEDPSFGKPGEPSSSNDRRLPPGPDAYNYGGGIARRIEADKLEKNAEQTRILTDRLKSLFGPGQWARDLAAGIRPLAEGGVVNRRTLALVGEKGPEAVVPKKGGKGRIVNQPTVGVVGEREPEAVIPIPTLYNNPGDIKWGPWARRHGAIGKPSRGQEAAFASYEEGRQAMEELLAERTIGKTIGQTGKWYAEGPEGGSRWSNPVAKFMGVSPNYTIKKEDIGRLADAIERQEGFKSRSDYRFVGWADRQLEGARARLAGGEDIESSGKIIVDVRAPKGTNVGAEGGGIFKDVELNREMTEAN